MNIFILLGGVLFAAIAAIAAASWANLGGIDTMDAVRLSSGGPQIIVIKAKMFQFSPSEITLKKGAPVILRLSSEDRTHGFLLRPFKIDTDIAPGKPVQVAVTPRVTGHYTVICNHYCGTGHGAMKMKVNVVD